MQLGINNNYQYQTNFGCNKIKFAKLDLKNKKELLNSLKHEMPKHNNLPTTSASEFYKNMGFKNEITLPNGITLHFPNSLKEMEEIIAKKSNEIL